MRIRISMQTALAGHLFLLSAAVLAPEGPLSSSIVLD